MSVLANKIIVVDAGHGGSYDGATYNHNLYGPIKEKDVALRVAIKLKEKLMAEDAVVRMTRAGDTDFGGSTASQDINNRVVYINSNFFSYAALLSLHLNTPTGRVGAFYQDGHNTSKVFAETISARLGISTYADNFAILRDTTVNCPKSLIEMGRISDASIHFPSFEENEATKIVDALRTYFS